MCLNGSGSFNTAVGRVEGRNNTCGWENVEGGYNALGSTTEGWGKKFSTKKGEGGIEYQEQGESYRTNDDLPLQEKEKEKEKRTKERREKRGKKSQQGEKKKEKEQKEKKKKRDEG